MPTVSVTGKDTVTINGRILNDFADGNIAELTFQNDLVTQKTGKNGNTIYGFNFSGQQCEVTLRLLRGSSDDKFLNGLLLSCINNFSLFTLMTGEFTKNIGDGAGNIQTDTYVMSGGAFKRQTDVVENADGNTDQSIAIWHLLFSNAPRAIG